MAIDARIEQHEAFNPDGSVYEDGLLWSEYPWLRNPPTLDMSEEYAAWLIKHFEQLDSTRGRDQGVPLFISYAEINAYADTELGLVKGTREFDIFYEAMRQLDAWFVSSAVDELKKSTGGNDADAEPYAEPKAKETLG